MQRCLILATKGRRNVWPNPMVGCVISHQGKIVAEGYHQKYGSEHAEINALSKLPSHIPVNECRVYVNLEPCSHQGKTPSCALRLVKEKPRHVIAGMLDPYHLVRGRGVEILRNAGIPTTVGILENECRALNERFIKCQETGLPWVILKWAQSKDGFIAGRGSRREKISGFWADKFTHQTRAGVDAIFVGRKTLLNDNPLLSTRLVEGDNPIPVVFLRKEDQKRADLQLLSNSKLKRIYPLKSGDWPELKLVLSNLYAEGIRSVLVEGGRQILDSFLKEGLGDELIQIKSNKKLNDGVKAPIIEDFSQQSSFKIGKDQICIYKKTRQ